MTGPGTGAGRSSRGWDGAPADAHEWVSFEDPHEQRHWRFDVTFLVSRWQCIFGRGCQGVLTAPAPELVEGCCSYGAHFVDQDDVARVQAAARQLRPDQWQFQVRARHGGTIRRRSGQASTTRLVDGACIFLNRPGFPGGPGCALHRAALEQGGRPMDLKPDVCWQLPLRRDEAADGEGHVTTTITQWDRRHWGGGGAEFHWWCTEAPEAFAGKDPVWRSMAAELIALIGPSVYLKVVAYFDGRAAAGVPLPHPTLRVARR